MTFLPSVVRAEHRGDFRLRVVFNDGSENTIDFSPWLTGPIFEPLKVPAFFTRYFIDGGTVSWPNGADVAPETLYAVPGRRAHNKRVRPTKRRQRSSKKSSRAARLRG
jgi:hypothetical protein